MKEIRVEAYTLDHAILRAMAEVEKNDVDRWSGTLRLKTIEITLYQARRYPGSQPEPAWIFEVVP